MSTHKIFGLLAAVIVTVAQTIVVAVDTASRLAW